MTILLQISDTHFGTEQPPVLRALVHGEPLGLSQWAAMACCGVSLWLVMLRGRA